MARGTKVDIPKTPKSTIAAKAQTQVRGADRKGQPEQGRITGTKPKGES